MKCYTLPAEENKRPACFITKYEASTADWSWLAEATLLSHGLNPNHVNGFGHSSLGRYRSHLLDILSPILIPFYPSDLAMGTY